MKNIEPQVYRQRLVIEARYTIDVTRDTVRDFLLGLAKELKMTLHPDLAGPIITSATGKAKEIHDGYEGIVVWVESGASLYVWERFKFLTADIYTCAPFDAKKAVEYTADFFKTSELQFKEV